MLDLYASMALKHTLAVQKIEGWSPDTLQHQDLYALANGKLKPLSIINKTVRMYQIPENMVYRKPLFSRYDPYLVQGKNILRNNYKITNHAALHQLETMITSVRMIELYKRAMLGKISRESVEITNLHVSLFGDIYPWAGYFRKIGVSKGESYFSPISAIAPSVEKIDAGMKYLHDQHTCGKIDHHQLAQSLAQYYAIYNYAHPFREGNGRTGMTWLELVSLGIGWHISFSNITPLQWRNASINAMPKTRLGATQPQALYDILAPNLEPIPQQVC